MFRIAQPSPTGRPARACAQWRTCCPHKVAHWLPLAGDCEVLNSTTYCWHLRTAGLRRRTWLRFAGPHFIAVLGKQHGQECSAPNKNRAGHFLVPPNVDAHSKMLHKRERVDTRAWGDRTELGKTVYIVCKRVYKELHLID